MPFFFIVPLWILTVVVGVVLVGIAATRRVGIYILVTSTFATVASFALSTAVLFVGPRIAADPPGWFGFILVAGYLAAIPIGGLIGAIAGFLLTHKVLAQRGARHPS